MHTSKALFHITSIVATFCLASLVGHIAFAARFESRAKVAAHYTPTPPQKIRMYSLNREHFYLPFIGESCAYCCIQPVFLDQRTGSRSLNHASFAHWLPTQMHMARDLSRMVAPHTTVMGPIGRRFINLPFQRGM